MTKRRGITLVELILAVALGSFVMLMMGEILSKLTVYYQGSSARDRVDTDARNALATMTRFLQQAKASSTIISTPYAAAPPYSRIDFTLAADTTTLYAFFYSTGTLQMQVTRGARISSPEVLAQHVTALNFTGDSMDPGYINITLRMDAPLGKGRTESVLFSNQSVHLVASQ